MKEPCKYNSLAAKYYSTALCTIVLAIMHKSETTYDGKNNNNKGWNSFIMLVIECMC
jgi:hypothetical protein